MVADVGGGTRIWVLCKDQYALLTAESSLQHLCAFLFMLNFIELSTNEDGMKAVGLNYSNILVFQA